MNHKTFYLSKCQKKYLANKALNGIGML